MEDDDEFRDLYMDVLLPFTSTSSSSDAPQPHRVSLVPPSLTRPINLNLKSVDDEILFGAPRVNSATTSPPSDQTLAPHRTELDLARNSIPRDEKVKDFTRWSRVLGRGCVKLPERAHPKDVKFNIDEVNTGIYDARSEPIIPALSDASDANIKASTANNDWDNDSEENLQIVLNDSNQGPMAMERGAIAGEEIHLHFYLILLILSLLPH